jgi:hypothetical protein
MNPTPRLLILSSLLAASCAAGPKCTDEPQEQVADRSPDDHAGSRTWATATT